MTLEKADNPLLFDLEDPEADTAGFSAPSVFLRHKSAVRTARRDIRDARRMKTAAEALAGFDRLTDIYAFTKGAFSIIDVITFILEQTGPARVDFSTWTAANADVTTVLDWIGAGAITKSRWLVDLTFTRRSPELAHRIRQAFGHDSIRVAKNHAKFALISTEGPDPWQVVVKTSMNLNFNPRFESVEIAHDPELWQFHTNILDEIWQKQKGDFDAQSNPYAIEQHFARDL